jgi:hypothetical protein
LKSLRPLQADDLEQVAALFLRVVRPGSGESVVETAEYFRRTTLEHPWADPEIPSLVFVDDRGAITGFVGSYVARMRLEGSPIRAACPGNLVADPEARGFAPGALLLREHLSGPQDVTFVDTLGEPTRTMWKALGGEIASLGALHWLRVFRPFRLANARFVEPRAGRASQTLVSALCAALDAVARRVGPGRLKAVLSSPTTRPLDAGAMMAEFRRLSASLRLYPDYDEAYLEWLFDELARPRRRGTLVRRLVRDGERVLGWYVYYLKPGGISRVLQVMGGEKDIGSVLDHLFHDADAAGAAALDGRVEPRLLEPLAERRCILRYAGAAGVHSHNREILDAVVSRRSVFTRMDSEYWPVPPRRP